MPDYDAYLMTTALICQKPMTSPEVYWKMKPYGEFSRDEVNYLLRSAEQFSETMEEDGKKSEYFITKEKAVKNFFMTRRVMYLAQKAYSSGRASPELQEHLHKLFTEHPEFLKSECRIADSDVRFIPKLQDVMLMMKIKKFCSSVPKLSDSLDAYSLGEKFTSKQVRRIAKNEIVKIFFAEVTGRNQHILTILPESQLSLFAYFTPEDILELYQKPLL